MDTISLQNTITLEKVFTAELQQRKQLRLQRKNTLLSIMVIASILLAIYLGTDFFLLIR